MERLQSAVPRRPTPIHPCGPVQLWTVRFARVTSTDKGLGAPLKKDDAAGFADPFHCQELHPKEYLCI